MPTRWRACTRASTCAVISERVASSIDRRYRYAYKPALFLACLVPLAWAIGGVLGLPVPSLSADPVRKVLGAMYLEFGTIEQPAGEVVKTYKIER